MGPCEWIMKRSKKLLSDNNDKFIIKKVELELCRIVFMALVAFSLSFCSPIQLLGLSYSHLLRKC